MSSLRVGAGHAPPARQQGLHRINRCCDRRDREKPSPGGWCSAQRIQNLYDCRWQSYLYYGGPAQAGPDEVEGNSVVPTCGDNRSLRPHQSQLTLRQLPLQGKPFLRSTGVVAQSGGSPYTPGGFAIPILRMKFERIGACRRPYRASPEVFPFVSPPRRPLWSFFSTLTARSLTMPRR